MQIIAYLLDTFKAAIAFCVELRTFLYKVIYKDRKYKYCMDRFAGFGVFGYAAYTNPQVADDHSTLFAILWSIFAVVLSFILVFCTYKDDAVKSSSQK